MRTYLNSGLSLLVHGLEWEEFGIILDSGVGPFPSDQSLGIKDRVLGVGGQLIFGGVSNQSLSVLSERHVGRGDSVTLVIGNDFHASVLHDAHTERNERFLLIKDNNPLNIGLVMLHNSILFLVQAKLPNIFKVKNKF